MKMTLLQAGWAPLVLSVMLVVGCTFGSGLVGVPGPGHGVPTGPPPLPSSDAGLADHVPQQIVIGFLSGADIRKVIAAVNGKALKEIKELNSVTVGLPSATSIVDTIRRLQGMAGVRYAEPNYVYHLFLTPSDPFFSKQWGPQKISAPAAWDITTGSPNSVIAVVDTDVDSTHPEFSGKILTGTNCTMPPEPVGTPVRVMHGTHVAGIAAAIGNNGVGIAGISWAAGILPIKVCFASSGLCDNSAIACGVVFGANFATSTMPVVENLSLGGAGYAQQIKDAIDYAFQKNVLVVASSGNDGKSTVLFPAGFPGVMAVGATTPTNDRATFSTYGSHLSVVAPGVDIYSTLPVAVGSYGLLSGTSMAAPHVAGVAALILSLSPGLSPTQVRSQIERTATHLGSSSFDPQFGWGLVNAAAALGALVPSNYGQVQITVQDATAALVGGADVALWVGTASCLGLTQVVQTAQTSSGGVGTLGVAPFNAVPVGSYCATASTMTQKGSTTAAFPVVAGTPTTRIVTIGP